ncbi:MAG: hypothetical protein IPI67_26455 [Myxococcales bacterium]|nr:hypothetical protein [Myxococcales bacterium]
MNKASLLTFAALAASTTLGCAGKPAPPFDTLKTANLTAFRLQNFEQPVTAPQPGQPQGMVPGLPPEISAWVQQGAQGLQALLPPGLLPPGMMNPQQPMAAQPVQDTTPRFHGFRILSQTQVMDEDLKAELGKILGKESNFDNNHAACLYAEMGLSFTSGGPSNDMLISYSCNQVAAKTFAWPHPATGMKPKTVQQLADVVQNLWPPGS